MSVNDNFGLLFAGDMDGMPKSSPASNPAGGGPGTPREDNGDISGQLFPPFQDNVSQQECWTEYACKVQPLGKKKKN